MEYAIAATLGTYAAMCATLYLLRRNRQRIACPAWPAVVIVLVLLGCAGWVVATPGWWSWGAAVLATIGCAVVFPVVYRAPHPVANLDGVPMALVLLVIAAVAISSGPNQIPSLGSAGSSTTPGPTRPVGPAPPPVTDGQVATALMTATSKYQNTANPDRTASARYPVRDGQLHGAVVDPADVVLWQLFSAVAVDPALRDSVSQVNMFGAMSFDGAYSSAYVEPLDQEGARWTVGINYDAVGDSQETAVTLIHEYWHLETLHDDQMTAVTEQPTSGFTCHTLTITEGCATEHSILWLWYQTHWLDNGLSHNPALATEQIDQRYLTHKELFVNDYAAMNPIEDYAETFAYWVLNEPIPDTKREYLESQPDLVTKKLQIRSNIVANGSGALSE